MVPVPENKLAKLITLLEEHLQGGVDYGGYRRSVENELRREMLDPDVCAWMDSMRQQNLAPLRRL